MNWFRFVNSTSNSHERGHLAGLMKAIKESHSDNSLANWVRETDQKITDSCGRQLTLNMFY